MNTTTNQEVLNLIKQEGDTYNGEYKGYKYYIRRRETYGFLCGYVQIPADDPLFGKSYNDLDITCHGGLTYGEHHLPKEPIATPGYYYIGFDCGHYNDLAPYGSAYSSDVGIYRSMSYCIGECIDIIMQIITKGKDLIRIEPADCPLCHGKLEHIEKKDTNIYTCEQCSFLGLEFNSNSDYKVLGKYLNI